MTEETDNESSTGIDIAETHAEPAPQADPVFHYILVLAEVIFLCDLGLQSRRTQFVNRSDQSVIPHARLVHLQKLAAQTVLNELREQSNGAIKVQSVEAMYILSTVDLGWMTEADFLAGVEVEVAAPATPVEDTVPTGDNVVPLRPA